MFNLLCLSNIKRKQILFIATVYVSHVSYKSTFFQVICREILNRLNICFPNIVIKFLRVRVF